jgi:predicted cupin superfamily sugar epimerase
MNAAAEKIIADFGLAPLPHEGGFFRQTWVSRERLANGRASGSAILFLLTPGDFSALHRLATDETWHFCAGDTVEHLQLYPHDGSARITRLGPDLAAGQQPQLTVPGGVWQGARLALSDDEELAPGVIAPVGGASTPSNGWSLLGCTMAPAWDEKEFTLGPRETLTRLFPAHSAWIEALTR